MVYFRDYEIHLLFLLLVKFHGSGKCEIYNKGFYCVFLITMSHLSFDIENADPLFLNVVFVKMISKLQRGFQQFCISKFRYDVGISIAW